MPSDPQFISAALEWSGLLAFFCVGVWIALRLAVAAIDLTAPKQPTFFPVSAQKLGFAQNIGEFSLIISDGDYSRRRGRLGRFRQIAKVWWPLATWAALAQFLAFYGAQGIAIVLEASFWHGLFISLSSLGVLGLYRRRMIADHLREASSLAEGRSLDWDAEAFLGGLRLRSRFEKRPHRIVLSRKDEDALSKDRSETVSWRGILAQPDSAHWHGSGLLVSEYRMLDRPDAEMTEANWLGNVKLRDALQAVLSAYVFASSRSVPAVALLEYPGAVIMVSPLAEHIEYLESVGDRLRKRKKAATMSAREISHAAGQEFFSRFDVNRISELLSRQEWIAKDRMPL